MAEVLGKDQSVHFVAAMQQGELVALREVVCNISFLVACCSCLDQGALGSLGLTTSSEQPTTSQSVRRQERELGRDDGKV